MADRAGRGAPPVHGRRRLGAPPAVGHGDRQLRRDGRRLSRGLPDEPGRRTRSRRSSPARRNRPTGTWRSSAGSRRTRPATGGDPLPSTAWHPEFQDVNNDGFIDLFVSKGNVNAMPDYADADPSDLLLGQPDGHVRAGRRAGRDRRLRPRARRRPRGLQPRRAARPRRGQPRRPGPRLAQRRRRARRTRPRRMGHWLGLRLRQPGGNRDAIGSVVEVRVGDTVIGAARSIVGGGHIGGQLGWTHRGLGPATEAEVRVTWPDGEQGPWQRRRRGPVRAHRARRSRRRSRGRRRSQRRWRR